MVAFRNPLLFSPKVFLCFPMLLFPGELFIANVLRWTLFLTPPLYLLIYCVSHFSTRTPFLVFSPPPYSFPNLSQIFRSPQISSRKLPPWFIHFAPSPQVRTSVVVLMSLPSVPFFPSLFPCAKFSPLFPLSLPLCQS